jgi:hypothetical protein
VGVGWPKTPEALYEGTTSLLVVGAIWLLYIAIVGIVRKRVGPWPLVGLFAPIHGTRAVLAGMAALALSGAFGWLARLSVVALN